MGDEANCEINVPFLSFFGSKIYDFMSKRRALTVFVLLKHTIKYSISKLQWGLNPSNPPAPAQFMASPE